MKINSITYLITPHMSLIERSQGFIYQKSFKSLETLKGRIAEFVKQPFSLKTANVSPSIPVDSNLEGALSENLNKLTKIVVACGILHVMHSLVSRSVDEAQYDLTKLSLNDASALWKMFSEKNKDLSCFKYMKVRLFCFFFWEIQVLQKMINAYVKNIFIVAHEEVIKNDRNRKQFIDLLMKNALEMLTVFNSETETFVQSNVGKPFEVYVDEILKALSVKIKTKHPGLFDSSSFLIKANTFLDKHPTHVRFQFGERILNYIFLRILKEVILPKVACELASSEPRMIAEIKNIIMDHPRPYVVLNLTHILAEQLQAIQREIEAKPAIYLHPVTDPVFFDFGTKLVKTWSLLPCLSGPGSHIQKVKVGPKIVNAFLGPLISEIQLSRVIQVAVTYLNNCEHVECILNDLMKATHRVCVMSMSPLIQTDENQIQVNLKTIHSIRRKMTLICMKSFLHPPHKNL